MNSPTGGAPRLAATLAITLAVQSLTAMALAVPAVLAPVASGDLGVEPSRVGLWVGFAYFAAMLAGVVCGALTGRYGPVRMLEVAVACVAAGLALASGARLALVFAAGVLLGIAHGLVNPASSTLLAAAAPPERRVTIFSIKQTGVPLGAALAGLLLPRLLLHLAWPRAVLLLALAAAALLAPLALYRRSGGSGSGARAAGRQRLRLAGIAAPLAQVLGEPALRELAFTSAIFSAVQMSFTTYLVSYLKLELGYSLVAAGAVFSAAQIAGVFGRVLWGAAADTLVPARLMLATLGAVMAGCGMAVALFTATWPFAAVLAVCVLYGASVVGWNGVFLAEVARLAPEGRVALATGGTQFFTFAGVLAGPPAFGAIAAAAGSSGTGFALFALAPLGAAAWLALSFRRGGGAP